MRLNEITYTSNLLNLIDSQPDLPMEIHQSAYDGAEGREYTNHFNLTTSAQRFAKFVILQGGQARIGRRGRDTYVYHSGVGPLTAQDFMREVNATKR